MRRIILTVATLATLAVPAAAHAATVPAGPHWGPVNRNVIGAASSTLRTGPLTPPLGVGSLNIDVATGADKAAYGNEVDYLGRPLSTITQTGYSVLQTGENAAIAPANLPSVALEIDPTGPSSATAPNFSTLVSLPTPAPVNVWSSQIESSYFLTGAAGTLSGCTQATPCTLAQAQAAFPDASVLTVQITKGRDNAWHGAVDALVLGGDVVDFEPASSIPGPAGPAGHAGPAGAPAAAPAAAAPRLTIGPAASCKGDDVRTIHAANVRGARILTVRATLRGKPLRVAGRTIRVDLRHRAEGNYNVRITARYRSAQSGRTFTRRVTRPLSVACA